MRPSSTVELDEAEWDRVIGINLKSVYLCMKYEIPHMQKIGGGVTAVPQIEINKA
jgi:NAD(P)-dependent dehydrogenase (short-subunit alcohol dehydrogenase family)